jgi:hypothetical protein
MQKLPPCPENGRTVRDQTPEVKFAFAEQSVSDRIAFVCWKSPNRTACQPSREMSRRAGLLAPAGTFSESGFSEKYAELRAFPPIFRGMPQGFSAVETCWRREVNSNSWFPFRECPNILRVSELAGFRSRN